MLGCQRRHEFSDSNAWITSTDVPPNEFHWPLYWIGLHLFNGTLASVYRLEIGLVQNAFNVSLNPELWMPSSCCKLVVDAVSYTMQTKSSLERTMALVLLSNDYKTGPPAWPDPNADFLFEETYVQVLTFRYCPCLFVCVSVCVSIACSRDNSRSV